MKDNSEEILAKVCVYWSPRGVGKEWNLPNIMTGEKMELQDNIAGFVRSREEGELAVAIFGGRAKLDYRPSEPQWIQVKVGGPEKAMYELMHLVQNNHNLLTPAIVEKVINKFKED